MKQENAPWRHCRAFREAIQDRLDGVPSNDDADAVVRQTGDRTLVAHFDDCAPCRDYVEGHILVRRNLSALPRLELPATVVENVWSHTRQSKPRPMRLPRWAMTVPFAAAALIALVIVPWRPSSSGPMSEAVTTQVDDASNAESSVDSADLARAAQQTQWVLALTGQAFARVEEAAVDDELVRRLSETITRVPRRWTARLIGKS